MKVYRNLSEYTSQSKAIVTVGTFDGVHIGHRKLLSTIKDLAAKEKGESVLLTFFPHPRLVLFPDDNDLKLLTTLDERIALLEKEGLDHLIIHPFSVDFSRTTALEYVRDILAGQIRVHKLVIGYDHHFGRNREGNLENLRDLAPGYGFEVIEIPAQDIKDVKVSSTKIRKALEEGDIARANAFLGYTYGFDGVVVKGNEIGRTIGFPTANIKPVDKHKQIPAFGVYVAEVIMDSSRYFGMVNIGVRPTVSESSKSVVEVHIFNFTGDIYSKIIRLNFLQRLRDEMRFENLNDLKYQLAKDAEKAKELLAELNN